jgi:hypothetical protein
MSGLAFRPHAADWLVRSSSGVPEKGLPRGGLMLRIEEFNSETE